ncbi:hypothetical protein D3C71_1383460 [compost metagenome]
MLDADIALALQYPQRFADGGDADGEIGGKLLQSGKAVARRPFSVLDFLFHKLHRSLKRGLFGLFHICPSLSWNECPYFSTGPMKIRD